MFAHAGIFVSKGDVDESDDDPQPVSSPTSFARSQKAHGETTKPEHAESEYKLL